MDKFAHPPAPEIAFSFLFFSFPFFLSLSSSSSSSFSIPLPFFFLFVPFVIIFFIGRLLTACWLYMCVRYGRYALQSV